MSRIGHKRNITTTVKHGIKYFDMYVRFDNGFIATKDDYIIHGKLLSDHNYGAAIYKDRQTTKRCVAYATGGSLEWCRKAVIGRLQSRLIK
jgi:hypothetical protein